MKNMRKVIATEYGQVHYHAGCRQCDFNAAIFTDKTYTAQDVRNAVRSHVLKTGHECWIESGTHTDYNLEGGRTQDAPDLKRASAKSDIESNPAVLGG